MNAATPEAQMSYIEAAEHIYQATRILDAAFEADRAGVSRMREWANLSPTERIAFALAVSEPMRRAWTLASAMEKLGGRS